MNHRHLRKIRYVALGLTFLVTGFFIYHLATRTWRIEKAVRMAEVEMKAGRFAEALEILETGWNRRASDTKSARYDEMHFLQGI